VADDPIKTALKLQPGYRPDWLARTREEVIDPERVIIDPHHHIWDRPGSRFLFDEALAEFTSGHKVVSTVHAPCHSMYRAAGPEELQPVGETEFINGIAAQSASGGYGPLRLCAGMVGTADLMLGSRIEPVLQDHLRAGGARFKGIRPAIAWHESDQVRVGDVQPGILKTRQARDALRQVAAHGLVLDVWVFFTQLDEVLDLCRAMPELPVVINHLGGPLGIGPYEGQREAVHERWAAGMKALARCENVVVKLGGLTMRYAGFKFHLLDAAPTSDLLVQSFRPYIEHCIEQFGANRCMFESNFPVDRGMCSYTVLWNAFKKLAASASAAEKDQLFAGTAARVYRLEPH
jgi:L-fuconolactonase